MHKIIVFDLDGTLAPVGGGVSFSGIEKLQALEDMGYKIAVCSGKPVSYLSGFARNLGLRMPILIGENGAEAYYGIAFPPNKLLHQSYGEKSREEMRVMYELIEKAAPGGSWYQPNRVCLTPFPLEHSVFDKIDRVISENGEHLTALTVYRHWDCFDFVPSNISKSSGIRMIADEEGLSAADFIAVGDGVNDVAMFEYADISILIGSGLDYDATFRFESIDKALEYILEKRL